MITLGADPEFFLDYNGLPALAHFFVPGTKARPHKTPHGWVQADGCAVEFNIEPASCKYQFANNINLALKDIRAYVPKQYKFKYTPTVLFNHDLWPHIPEEAKEIGCDPDYSADREGQLNHPPDFHFSSIIHTMRNGGGHLHIGWGSGLDYADRSTKWDMIQVVHALHTALGTYSMLWDMDSTRSLTYGSGGAFRPKSFGVEYRGLSNAWLNHPGLWPWLYEASDFLFKKLREGQQITNYIAHRPYGLINNPLEGRKTITVDEIETKRGNFNKFFKMNFVYDWPELPPGSLNTDAIIEAHANNKRLRKII